MIQTPAKLDRFLLGASEQSLRTTSEKDSPFLFIEASLLQASSERLIVLYPIKTTLIHRKYTDLRFAARYVLIHAC
jgi:hypothetical protein